MHILAFDTSTEYCSVALWRDGTVFEREIHAGQRHSQLLLGMVDEVLREGGVALERLDGIAYGEGPGTFTGLRIACAVTQGLAFAADLRVAGVSTLLTLAVGAGADRVVCCLDARMQQVYYGAYERAQAGWAVAHAAALYHPSEVPGLAGSGWVGCGSGFAAYGDVLSQRYGGQIVQVYPDAFPRARHVAELARPVFVAGAAASPDTAAPCYIRDKVALKTNERAT